MVKKIKALLKLVIAWLVLNLFRRDLYKKEIWLIREKGTEARDNGYHFFKYMRTEHPECNVYYAITHDAPDLRKIKRYGNIIELNSFNHYLYYLAAKYSINSQARGAIPYPDVFLFRFRKLARKGQKTVFLQHGVIKDDLSDMLDYERAPCDLFCCSAQKERDYVQVSCHYPEKKVQLLGLCRFDELSKNKTVAQKKILVMPTYRGWLKSANAFVEASKAEKTKFEQSEYFQQYSSLLSNERLVSILKKYGYSMVFYPHYGMQPFVHCFDRFATEVVTIADRLHFDVQQLMIESAIMVTDYSSVFFDFAYMEKPEVFFQFDEEQYRAEHYKTGYFDYRRDGFGPVFTDVEDVTEYIAKTLENNCQLEPKYLERIRDFFDLRDDKNCERTYQAIISLDGVH